MVPLSGLRSSNQTITKTGDGRSLGNNRSGNAVSPELHHSVGHYRNDGFILTNAHVVGTSKTVMIITENGLEIEGEVLRVHEPRDVALIKIPVRVRKALAISKLEPGVLDQVYVVGSPIYEDMHSTVTKGIISAYRKMKDSDNLYLQSDAAISGGNSGGPMLNINGHVVAISVASLSDPTAKGLNLFIPIQDALEALKIRDEDT